MLSSTKLSSVLLKLCPLLPPGQLFARRKLGVMGGGGKSEVSSGAVEEGEGESGRRGALVVVEGCDRTGKTTQAKKLVEFLTDSGRPAILMRFPERTTHIGGIINSYLTKAHELDDHAIHLLFSANRWELLPEMKKALQAGTSIVIDRYAYSGVAFSAAKPGLSLEWCKGSDSGLPRPDLVLFLDLTPAQAEARGGYGIERYESQEFQTRVRDNYHKLKDDSWKMIDADRSIEDLQEMLRAKVVEIVDSVGGQELGVLW